MQDFYLKKKCWKFHSTQEPWSCRSSSFFPVIIHYGHLNCSNALDDTLGALTEVEEKKEGEEEEKARKKEKGDNKLIWEKKEL